MRETPLAIVLPPKNLPWRSQAIRARPKTPVTGGGGLRARWKDDGAIYEWDYQHGHVEEYDPRGHHRCSRDARDGHELAGADRTRRVEP